jgi:GT2 family glycosyltransferase
VQTARLALVVVTRERASVFERFLLPSLRHVPPSDVDVVVVDQSAGSETRELLRELPWVRYLRSEPGLSRGRNVGVAATEAEITVFTDDDVEFDPDWLFRIRALFDDPAVGVVCGRGIDSQGEPLPYRAAGIYRAPTNPFSVGHGFNMAFRRKALQDAGPFDEGLGAGSSVPAAEDTDMFYRVMREGWAVRCDDGITVRHHDWRNRTEERDVYEAYGHGFAAQTLKHARSGDTTAVRIAATHLARHGKWMALALARRDRRALAHHRAWRRGVIAAIVLWLRPRGGSR